MADYIDRKALLDSICGNIRVTHRPGEPSLEIRGANKVINFIESAPAADVVEVVRCENCVSSGGDRFGEVICQNQLCPCYGREVDHAFSCIYGERRGE